MSWMEIMFNAVSNILNIYIDFRVMKLFLSKKKVNVILQTIIYIMVWLINCIIYLFLGNMYLVTGSLTLLLLITAFLLYDGSMIRKLTAVISAIALGILFEEIVWRIFVWLGESNPNGATGSLLSSFLYIIFVFLIEHFFCVDKMDYISKSSYFNIILILGGSVVLVEILASFDYKSELTLIGLSAICLINVSTFYLYDKVNDVYRETLDSKVMEERIAMHENQSALMKQSQENIRSLWHDMKNHLLLLETYISQAEYEKASQYIKNIQDYMYVPGQHVNSGNYEVDAILNYRLDKAEKMGCQIKTKLKVPDCSFMSDFDLNMILGNLLDNALEALEHTKNKYLSVELKYEKGILVIRICNSYDGTLQQNGREFVTRKQDRKNHGLGLRNVEQIVKKYNGEQMIQTEDAIFKTSVILYVT
ncbi:MAG: GHKL domain-containing protein [Roseburia sp.]|nr:GHKL domain-containing protein [Roseburia sp.]